MSHFQSLSSFPITFQSLIHFLFYIHTGTGHNNSITYNKHKIEISQDNSNHSEEKFGFILNITVAIDLIFLI